MLIHSQFVKLDYGTPNLFHPEFLTKIKHSKNQSVLTTIGLFFLGATHGFF